MNRTEIVIVDRAVGGAFSERLRKINHRRACLSRAFETAASCVCEKRKSRQRNCTEFLGYFQIQNSDGIYGTLVSTL